MRYFTCTLVRRANEVCDVADGMQRTRRGCCQTRRRCPRCLGRLMRDFLSSAKERGKRGGRGTLNGGGLRKGAKYDSIPRGTKLRWLTGVAVRRIRVDVMDGDDCWLPSQSGLVLSLGDADFHDSTEQAKWGTSVVERRGQLDMAGHRENMPEKGNAKTQKATS